MIKRILINAGETTERTCMKTVGQQATFSFTNLEIESMQFSGVVVAYLVNKFPVGNRD